MSVNKFIPGFLVASLLFGGTAFAVSVNNTSEGGYLLCGNLKTKDVTFPGSLKCPSGTIPIEVPGRGQNEVETPQNTGTTSSTPSSGKGSSDCNLQFLIKNSSLVDSTLAKCSSAQLNQLITDYSKYDQEMQAKIQEEQAKLLALKNKASSSSGAAAQEAADAVMAQAQRVSDLIASTKSSINLMSSLVIAIQKKVKAG